MPMSRPPSLHVDLVNSPESSPLAPPPLGDPPLNRRYRSRCDVTAGLDCHAWSDGIKHCHRLLKRNLNLISFFQRNKLIKMCQKVFVLVNIKTKLPKSLENYKSMRFSIIFRQTVLCFILFLFLNKITSFLGAIRCVLTILNRKIQIRFDEKETR